MIRAPRVPRPSRPVLLTILVTALLAFPMGIVLASHQFSDVPNSNPFHADIDALVDSSVTAGCGGGKYCPKAAVTREQMAAFLNRLGALAPGKTPVVNADKVDGINSTGFVRYGANVPGNAQVTGVFAFGGTATGAGNFAYGQISFVAPLNGPPTAHVILPATPVPAGCGGSVSAPSASAGHLCVFVGSTTNATALAVGNPVNGSTGTASSRGASLRSTSAGAGSFGYVGTWAARSPLTLSHDSTENTGVSIFGP